MRHHQAQNDLKHYRGKSELQGMQERNLKNRISQELEVIFESDKQGVARIDQRLFVKEVRIPDIVG